MIPALRATHETQWPDELQQRNTLKTQIHEQDVVALSAFKPFIKDSAPDRVSRHENNPLYRLTVGGRNFHRQWMKPTLLGKKLVQIGCSPPFQLGTEFEWNGERRRVERILGVSDNAVVYRIRSLGTDVIRDYAMKCCLRCTKWSCVHLREYEILDTLSAEPSILKVHGMVSISALIPQRSDYRYCFFMESVEGTLKEAIYEKGLGGGLGVLRVQKIASGVMRELELLFKKKLLHADLHPGNLGLTQEGDVKILDYGLSAFEKDFPSFLKNLLCLREYRPPEMAFQITYHFAQVNPDIVYRADIWSLGCALFESMVGKDLVGFCYRHLSKSIKQMIDAEIQALLQPLKTPFTHQDEERLKEALRLAYCYHQIGDFQFFDLIPAIAHKNEAYRLLKETIQRIRNRVCKCRMDSWSRLMPKNQKMVHPSLRLGADEFAEAMRDFVDMLSRMLVCNPYDRANIYELKDHPFITKDYQQGKERVSSEILPK